MCASVQGGECQSARAAAVCLALGVLGSAHHHRARASLPQDGEGAHAGLSAATQLHMTTQVEEFLSVPLNKEKLPALRSIYPLPSHPRDEFTFLGR